MRFPTLCRICTLGGRTYRGDILFLSGVPICEELLKGGSTMGGEQSTVLHLPRWRNRIVVSAHAQQVGRSEQKILVGCLLVAAQFALLEPASRTYETSMSWRHDREGYGVVARCLIHRFPRMRRSTTVGHHAAPTLFKCHLGYSSIWRGFSRKSRMKRVSGRQTALDVRSTICVSSRQTSRRI